MALAQAADGGVAGHLADGLEFVGEQQGARAKARRGRRGFAAGMAAADHDDVEASCAAAIRAAKFIHKSRKQIAAWTGAPPQAATETAEEAWHRLPRMQPRDDGHDIAGCRACSGCPNGSPAVWRQTWPLSRVTVMKPPSKSSPTSRALNWSMVSPSKGIGIGVSHRHCRCFRCRTAPLWSAHGASDHRPRTGWTMKPAGTTCDGGGAAPAARPHGGRRAQVRGTGA